MRKLLAAIPAIILLAACGSGKHTCTCTDKGNGDKKVSEYQLQGSKENAAFECRQKKLQLTGPQYEQVDCAVK